MVKMRFPNSQWPASFLDLIQKLKDSDPLKRPTAGDAVRVLGDIDEWAPIPNTGTLKYKLALLDLLFIHFISRRGRCHEAPI